MTSLTTTRNGLNTASQGREEAGLFIDHFPCRVTSQDIAVPSKEPAGTGHGIMEGEGPAAGS